MAVSSLALKHHILKHYGDERIVRVRTLHDDFGTYLNVTCTPKLTDAEIAQVKAWVASQAAAESHVEPSESPVEPSEGRKPTWRGFTASGGL